MFDIICFFGWEYDRKKDKQFKKEGYSEDYEICHTCKHFNECHLKNLEYLDTELK